MLPILLLPSLAALVFIYLFMPSLWRSIMALDDCLDAHESSLALVAYRVPFQESGPPICMAKLMMLRRKIQQTNNRKRRIVTHTRQPRSYSQPPIRQKAPWMRLSGKAFGSQHH